MNKEINRLFKDGAREIYICRFCGEYGRTENLLFRNKMSECCPNCQKAFFITCDWVDFILNFNKINETIKSIKNIYNRRSKVKLVLNKQIIEKIKNEGAIKQIKCPKCNGQGHCRNFVESETYRGFITCDECSGGGIIKVDKNNYLKYINDKDK